jgi:hypothetical protein
VVLQHLLQRQWSELVEKKELQISRGRLNKTRVISGWYAEVKVNNLHSFRCENVKSHMYYYYFFRFKFPLLLRIFYVGVLPSLPCKSLNSYVLNKVLNSCCYFDPYIITEFKRLI